MQQPHEADQRLQSTKLWKNIQRPIQLCGSFPSNTTSPQPGKSVTTCSVDLLIFAENPTVLEKSLFGAKRELFKLCHLQIKYRSQGIVELPYRGDHASSMEISLEIYAYLGIQYLMIAAGSPSNINPLLKCQCIGAKTFNPKSPPWKKFNTSHYFIPPRMILDIQTTSRRHWRNKCDRKKTVKPHQHLTSPRQE